MSSQKFKDDLENCIKYSFIVLLLLILILLLFWTPISLVYGPLCSVILNNYLSFDEKQCTITNIDIPEQMPSNNYTNYWKGCECNISGINGYIPCIKYYTDLEPSKMVIGEIIWGVNTNYDTDCTYLPNDCQCNTNDLNATISRMITLKNNETGMNRICYQSNNNDVISFTNSINNSIIVMMIFTWGWLFILTCIIIRLLYKYNYKSVSVVENNRVIDVESLTSRVSKPPSYNIAVKLPPPYGSHNNDITTVSTI
jgi:hypothetical protein